MFVDGVFVPELSDLTPEPGLTIGSHGGRAGQRRSAGRSHVGKTFETDDVAVALNTALMGDGAVIRVADGAVIKRPIHLVFAAGSDKPSSAFMRSLIVVEQGRRRVTLIEEHDSGAAPGQRRARACGRRRGARSIISRSTQARGAARRRACWPASAPRRSFNTFAFTCDVRRRAQSDASSALPARAPRPAFAASTCCAARSMSTRRC